MPDNHVLRVAHERSDAADVCAGRERDQIRQQREFTAPDHRDYKRRQHQTDRVVNEQCRENAGRKREIKQ